MYFNAKMATKWRQKNCGGNSTRELNNFILKTGAMY